MYRVVDLKRVHVYGDPNNFCAEVSVANLGGGELVGVLAQNRGLVHTDTGTIHSRAVERPRPHLGSGFQGRGAGRGRGRRVERRRDLPARRRDPARARESLAVPAQRAHRLEIRAVGDRRRVADPIDRQGAHVERAGARQLRADAQRAGPRRDRGAAERGPASAAARVPLAAHACRTSRAPSGSGRSSSGRRTKASPGTTTGRWATIRPRSSTTTSRGWCACTTAACSG